MARTVDQAVYAVRRDAFVDVAQRLIASKGFEQMSIQDVLDEVGASRGAFYHYFDSKTALLDAVVDRLVRDAMTAIAPTVEDPDRPATDKLSGLFLGIASWKTERADLMLRIMEVWRSDDNAIVREKFRRGVVAVLTPLLVDIIRQGAVEGAFDVTSPEHSARVLVALLLGLNEHAGDLYVARQTGELPFEVVEGALAAYPEAIERILGARRGSLQLTDQATLRRWFG
jgi:AcrR family transcriptional regulator